jgi:transposase
MISDDTIHFSWRKNMNGKNRYYPPEFKREALEMLATGEYNMAQLERELGITSGLLRQWKRNAIRNGEYVSPNVEPTTPAAAEARVRQLERENARLRQEREILKKAMAIFSSRRQ